MKKEEFINILKDRNIELTNKQINQLDEYASFLVEYNENINLTSITEYEDILEKHFYDSLLLSFHIDLKGTLVDVGTGAGFPGVVLKIVYPELRVLLLEPIKKRCIFLNELINRLGLIDIEVKNVRGEEYSLSNKESYDFVTARAVTNMSNLIEICGAMVKIDGYFIALRGLEGENELKNSKKAYETMGFSLEKQINEELLDGSKRVIGYLKKLKNTPIKYPRKYSIIKQKPL